MTILVASSLIFPLGVQVPFAIFSLLCVYLLLCDQCANRCRWSTYDAVVIWLLCCRALSELLNMSIHLNFDWAELDNPSRYLYAIPVYLALRANRNINLHMALGIGLLSAGVVGAGMATFEAFEGVRAHGVYNNPISFGNVLAITSCMLMGFAVCEPSSVRRHIFIVCSLFAFCGVIASQSRGSLLIFGSLLVVVVSSKSRERDLGFLLLFLFLGAVVSWYLGLGPRFFSIFEGVQCFIRDGAICDGSVSMRLEIFYVAVSIWLDNLWFGVGVGNSNAAFEAAIASGVAAKGFVAFDHPHNELIAILLEQGLAGILGSGSFYVVFFILITRIERSRMKSTHSDTRCSAAIISLVFVSGFVLSGLSQVNSSHSDISSYFAVFTSIILAHTLNSAGVGYARVVKS